MKIVNFRQLALMYLIFVIDFEFVPRALEALQFHFAGAVTSFDADSLNMNFSFDEHIIVNTYIG